MTQPNLVQTTFNHVILRGSAYEVGQEQARQIEHIPGFVEFFRSGRDIPARLEFRHALSQFSRYNPGLVEEIEGFCDVLKIPPEHLIYYASTCLTATHCSHLVVLPSLTEAGHILVGRNYDFGDTMDDMRLCSTYIEGKYAHIGFSNMFFGRNDGLNEHGLSVTVSVGGLPVGLMTGLRAPLRDGFQFWALVRTMLEQCRTVEEAIEVFQEFPNCGNPILILADSSGAAALAEAFGAHKAIRRIDDSGPDKYLIATNHFLSPEMRRLEPTVFNHSRTRYRAAQAYLDQAAPHLNVEAIKRLLSTIYPAGLCCHYYREFFGCLHSLVFDLTTRQVEVAFGSPAANDWHTISFSPDIRPGVYPARLPLEQSQPDFWPPVE